MLDSGSPPDLVLDLTQAGISSEVIKSLSLTLGLPTVSASMGEEGDIRSATVVYSNIVKSVKSPVLEFVSIDDYNNLFLTLFHLGYTILVFSQTAIFRIFGAFCITPSFKVHKDPGFLCGDICKMILMFFNYWSFSMYFVHFLNYAPPKPSKMIMICFLN